MKKLLILFLLIIQSINSYADAGSAYRYKIEILSVKYKITGYVYHYTYEEEYNSNKEEFFDFFIREFHNTPYIYTEIHSIIGLDFCLPKNRLEFNQDLLIEVNLLEKEEFGVGDKIKLIENEKIYNLIGSKKFQEVIVESKASENCTISIIDFSLKADFKKIQLAIDALIKKHYVDENSLPFVDKEFYPVYNKLKEDMHKNNILIIDVCSAL